MPDWKKVNSGDQLRIPASDWNGLMDIGELLGRTKTGAGERTFFPGSSLIAFLSNQTGQDLKPFSAVGLGAALNQSGTLDWAFQQGYVGELPTVNHIGGFGITMNAIETGKIGRVAVAGIVPAYVEMDDDGDEYADVQPSSFNLRSGAGTARLLYVQPRNERTIPGSAWCYVQLGAIEWQSFVKLTGATVVTTNRWRYSGIEQRPKLISGRMDFEDRTSGQTWTNIFSPPETFNVAARSSTPVPSTGIPQASPYPAGFNVQPLANGLVVPIRLRRMKEGNTVTRVPWIVYGNADWGTCS